MLLRNIFFNSLLGIVAGVLSGCGSSPSKKGPAPTIQIKSSFVEIAPEIDGVSDDIAWKSAESTVLEVGHVHGKEKGKKKKLSIKSLHTGTHIFFVVSWPDSTQDLSHKTWVWDDSKKSYGAGDDREDVLSLSFDLSGRFSANMLSGNEMVWDVWQWKSARTDISGYAMDKTHHYTKEKPDGKAKSFKIRGGGKIWIARPEDKGDSPQKTQPAPSTLTKKRIPQYIKGVPSGSAADIRAKGLWKDGVWTVELARKLRTGHEDDTNFDTDENMLMAIAVFDHSEHIHHSASGVIELNFTAP